LSEVPLLEVRGLGVARGKRPVLFDVSFSVRTGEIVAVIGSNGSGKSTFFQAVVGLLPYQSGEILLDGRAIEPTPRQMLCAGVAYAPQSNALFRDLTVLENLQIAVAGVPRSPFEEARLIQETIEQYPWLRERRLQHAGALSGGEQQMLAVICALQASPRLLLLDEPCGGLTSAKAKTILDQVVAAARQRGAAAVIIEQRVREILAVADRVVLFRRGTISFSGPPAGLGEAGEIRKRLFF